MNTLCGRLLAVGFLALVVPMFSYALGSTKANAAPESLPFMTNSFAPMRHTFVAKQTVSSAATDVTFSSLNGDTDTVYVLQAFVKTPSGVTAALDLQLNGDTAGNYKSLTFEIGNPAGQETQTSLSVGRMVPSMIAGGRTIFTLVLYAKSGTNRIGFVDVGMTNSADGTFRRHCNTVTWTNTSSNITSLTIHEAIGSNRIDTGSEFVLYKLPQS